MILKRSRGNAQHETDTKWCNCHAGMHAMTDLKKIESVITQKFASFAHFSQNITNRNILNIREKIVRCCNRFKSIMAIIT